MAEESKRNQSTDLWLEEHEREICQVAEDIFQYAEIAEQENASSERLSRYLKMHGFAVQSGVGGMPTSLRAVWGKGKPCIGFLGEYDALPGMNQGPSPVYSGDEKLPGHGCGHNLLGTGAAAAAVALRYALEEEGREGTVIFYGCPAEEILKGKIVMAENGCFKELDAALSWHPSDVMNPGNISYSAMDSIEFTFYGKAAHAAARPHMGRSALDAAELMDTAANYMREHVPEDVRIHYAPIDCGIKPNIVPPKAKVWYFVRARSRKAVDSASEWLLDIARGAGLMTGTTPSWEFLCRGQETLVNQTMCRVIYEAMCETEKPAYTQEELAFAEALAASAGDNVSYGKMDLTIPKPDGSVIYNCGSTDVSDVSHIVPTGYFKVACMPFGISLHSWMTTACAAMGLGHKGMLFASKVMAKAGLRLITEEGLLAEVKKEFENN